MVVSALIFMWILWPCQMSTVSDANTKAYEWVQWYKHIFWIGKTVYFNNVWSNIKTDGLCITNVIAGLRAKSGV